MHSCIPIRSRGAAPSVDMIVNARVRPKADIRIRQRQMTDLYPKQHLPKIKSTFTAFSDDT